MVAGEIAFRKIAVIIVIFNLVVLLGAPCLGMETKTAYTRDGINFVSKERVEENIRYEYAKPGEYREVQVPLSTVVVNSSYIPEEVSSREVQENSSGLSKPAQANRTATVPEKEAKYPYATLGIGLLLIGGIVIFIAASIRGRY
jgi:hypothetical protein